MQVGKGKSTSTPKDLTPAEYKSLRPLIANVATQFFPELGTSFQDYLGAGGAEGLTVPMGKDETGAYRAIMGGFKPEMDLLGQTVSGKYLTPESNPFLQGYIEAAQRPIREAYRDQELAQRALFSKAGQKIQESSPFSMAQAKLTGDYLSSLGDVGARIAYENYAQERERQTQAVQQRFDLARQQLEVSALPRMIQEMGIERGQAEFNRRMALVQEILQMAASLSAPTPATEYKQSDTRFGLTYPPDYSSGEGGYEIGGA